MTEQQHPALAKLMRDRAELVARLEHHEREVAKTQSQYDAACDAATGDAELTTWQHMWAVGARLRGYYAAIEKTRGLIARLDEPSEAERRIETYDRLGALKHRHEGEHEMSPTTDTSTDKAKADKAEVHAKVVAYVNEAKNYTKACKRLNDEGVPTLGKSASWHPPVVRAIYIAVAGDAAAKKLARKPAAKAPTVDTPPEPVADVTKTKAEPKAEAKPDPKPTSTKKPRRSRAKATAKA